MLTVGHPHQHCRGAVGLILPWGATCLLGPQDRHPVQETLSQEAKKSTRWPEPALGVQKEKRTFTVREIE